MDKKSLVLISVLAVISFAFIISTIVLAVKLKKSSISFPSNDKTFNVNTGYKIPTYIAWLQGTVTSQNLDVIQDTLNIIRTQYPMSDLATENDLNLVSKYLAMPGNQSNTNFEENGYFYGSDYTLSIGYPSSTGVNSFKPTVYPATFYSMWIRIPSMDTFDKIQSNLAGQNLTFLLPYANILLN
jgi:hypothetical protein